MSTTTMKDLEGLVNRLNVITGNNPKMRAVGTYLLDGAYGGWKLAQTVNEGGGERNVLSIGYVSKKECYYAIHAYIRGIEDCIVGDEQLNQRIKEIIG